AGAVRQRCRGPGRARNTMRSGGHVFARANHVVGENKADGMLDLSRRNLLRRKQERCNGETSRIGTRALLAATVRVRHRSIPDRETACQEGIRAIDGPVVDLIQSLLRARHEKHVAVRAVSKATAVVTTKC